MPQANQAAFRFLPYSPLDVLREVRRLRFPDLRSRVYLSFVSGRTQLACINVRPSWAAFIRINHAVDRPDTPVDVFAHILTHELLHIEVPPERRGRRLDMHPPLFWERQTELSPDQLRCEDWIYANLGHCLRRFGDGIWVCPTRIGRLGSAPGT